MFSAVNVYLDHLKVVCINGRRYVCCSECNVVSNECKNATPCLMQPIGTHDGEVMYFGCVCFIGELSFLNCYDMLLLLSALPFHRRMVEGSNNRFYAHRS